MTGIAKPPTARSVAARVLVRVVEDQAFAAAALDAELSRAVQLDARDRGLATELVYGTLRMRPWLLARVGKHAPRGLDGLPPEVRAHLVIAAYQIAVLTRVPPFAAVSEAVSLVRDAGGAKVAGFANAVLRKVAAEPRPEPATLARAVLDALDPGLAAEIVRSIGEEGALALVSGSETPPLGLRVERAEERDAWLARLREAAPSGTFEPGMVSPHAVLARGAGRLTDLPGYAEGAWSSQEEGSQLVALALGARPGDVVLDACAGRGNKTGLLARAVGPGGAVDASDVHPKKLERLRQELARLGLAPRRTYAVDWTQGVGAAEGPYDRVLVDAPCSGTGTMRRRPELLARRAAGDLVPLAETQLGIVRRVATLVRPGGRLVYAVCSVLASEAEAVVDQILADASLGLRAAPFDVAAACAIADDASAFRLLPHVHGTDGYFVASFVRG